MENSAHKQQENKKWGILTYFSNKVHSITKIFNTFNVKIALRGKNTIGKLLKTTEKNE
jgi:hypothetical protein